MLGKTPDAATTDGMSLIQLFWRARCNAPSALTQVWDLLLFPWVSPRGHLQTGHQYGSSPLALELLNWAPYPGFCVPAACLSPYSLGRI